METLFKILSVLVSIFTLLTSLLGLGRNGYEPLDSGNLKMSAVLISDTHIDTKTTDAKNDFDSGIRDMAASKVAADMLIITGDLTNNGKAEEYDVLFSSITKKAPVKKVITAIGNHDAWSTGFINNFTTAYNQRTFSSITGPYYSYSTGGYTVLVLGTEKGLQESADFQNQAYLSDTQLSWLDTELSKACSSSDKPVFVVCHQPINGTNRQYEAWALGGVGNQSDQLLSILKRYADAGHTIILSSGHLHNSIGYSGVTSQGNLWFVDVPSFGVIPSRGDNRVTGTGYVVECYPGKVIVRARNFVSRYFMEGYEYTIPTTESVTPVEITTKPSATTTTRTQPEVTTKKPDTPTAPPIFN